MTARDPFDPAGTAHRATELRLLALPGIPLVGPGDDLAALILEALAVCGESLRDGDVLVIAQKIVSKAEGRVLDLGTVRPSARALALAAETGKDPRLVELILVESDEVVRHGPGVIVVAHRLGFVMANAGIDQSNVRLEGGDAAILLPRDPDASCASLRAQFRARGGADVGVVINDSHGRAWRNGTVGVALGVAGLPALVDLRGRPDLYERTLRATEVGLADELASAASLLMGQGNEGRPVVLARGVPYSRHEGSARELVRPRQLDLFRSQANPTPPAIDRAAFRAMADLIATRRSIRGYAPAAILPEFVDELLRCAVSAPSAHNRQPWRFAVIHDSDLKARLARAMGERLRADRLRDGDAPDVVEADVARSIQRITTAPVVVVVAATSLDMDAYPDPRRREAEYQMAVQSTAMAVQNLLLAAHSAGLAACWMCAPLFCPDTVRAVMTLPADWQPQTIITLGVPAAQGKPYSRRPLAEVVRRMGSA